jgi:hypothetical protein
VFLGGRPGHLAGDGEPPAAREAAAREAAAREAAANPAQVAEQAKADGP